MIRTWQAGDVRDNERYNGDCVKAPGAIKARAIVTPGKYALSLPPEASAFEVAHVHNAGLRPFDSNHGHFAGGSGLSQKDVRFLDDALKELLAN